MISAKNPKAKLGTKKIPTHLKKCVGKETPNGGIKLGTISGKSLLSDYPYDVNFR